MAQARVEKSSILPAAQVTAIQQLVSNRILSGYILTQQNELLPNVVIRVQSNGNAERSATRIQESMSTVGLTWLLMRALQCTGFVVFSLLSDTGIQATTLLMAKIQQFARRGWTWSTSACGSVFVRGWTSTLCRQPD
jgi:hypothetical protein